MKVKVTLIITLLISVFIVPTALAANDSSDTSSKYLPEEIIAALKTKESTILNDVILPGSMNIEIPNINMEKIINTNPLSYYGRELKEDLEKHGYSEQDIAAFNYEDYARIAGSWKLNEKQIKIAKSLYPELKDENINEWTNADFEKYGSNADQIELEKRFTKPQLEQIKQKGITSTDMFYLFKEFHTVDTIMSQSDEVLKRTIQDYYQFKLDQITSASTRSLSNYTYVYMPRYGWDYFLNAVCTSEYWRQVQSDRTLVAFRTLYDNSFSTFSGYVTNMYGTYSQSQGGAHEGIDFAYGSTGQDIYAIFDGEVISGGLYHQLSVYDEDVDKTYNFLHMSSINVSSGDPITHGDYVGDQGAEGNATGPHVHFEVHSDCTTALSAENNDTLGSISPYQLQIYLGEL